MLLIHCYYIQTLQPLKRKRTQPFSIVADQKNRCQSRTEKCEQNAILQTLSRKDSERTKEYQNSSKMYVSIQSNTSIRHRRFPEISRRWERYAVYARKVGWDHVTDASRQAGVCAYVRVGVYINQSVVTQSIFHPIPLLSFVHPSFQLSSILRYVFARRRKPADLLTSRVGNEKPLLLCISCYRPSELNAQQQWNAEEEENCCNLHNLVYTVWRLTLGPHNNLPVWI